MTNDELTPTWPLSDLLDKILKPFMLHVKCYIRVFWSVVLQ